MGMETGQKTGRGRGSGLILLNDKTGLRAHMVYACFCIILKQNFDPDTNFTINRSWKAYNVMQLEVTIAGKLLDAVGVL